MTPFTRRRLLQFGAAAGASVVLPLRFLEGTRAAAQAPGILDPTKIDKYVAPLVVPPGMPRSGRLPRKGKPDVDFYAIGVRQFRQQLLPPGMPETTVWSYGSVNHPSSFNYPAFTIQAKHNTPVRVKWINGLMDGSRNYLPHLLPVDPTLHWANPPGGRAGRDSEPRFTGTPGPYTGPVPIVTHLHGGESRQESDGYPEAWYLPAAANIPAGYASVGSQYREFKSIFKQRFGVEWKRGTAVAQYANDQPAATLWYHDHTLGMTRANVYAGPAGFYLIHGGDNDLPRRALPRDDIPIAIQDRSFYTDGSLFYPGSREFFDEFAGPYIGQDSSDIPPIWNPEFFANTMVANGRTWPVLEVEQRRYRFRLLNGCNSRFLILKLATDPLAARPAPAAVPFWQIGAEGGFLRAPVQLPQLLISPAERADVIVDFGALPVGTALYLINEGPDEPFGGGAPGTDFPAADPNTTGQVMKFVVAPRTSRDRSKRPERLDLPTPKRLGRARKTRRLSLNEADSAVLAGVGPREAELGTVGKDGRRVPLGWDHPITESPRVGATEIWELHNFTQDAHPIHIHEVQFQVLDRRPLRGGAARGRESWESGLKDTVIALPEEVTRVKARFDRPGLFVWHCHILEHEDNEMMRPYRVLPKRRRRRKRPKR
ncbi:MAG TPA: multicopper oxidase [Solirubrobacterales bacterium]|nr:multicopper oxidase [Solirubrobacterales bacterium]